MATNNIARFVRSHPGFYVGHDGHGVVIQIECVGPDGEEWIEYLTALTMDAAREALGY